MLNDFNCQVVWGKKWGILSDIHGNIDAFNSCLKKMSTEGVSNIFFLGDAVGYLPHVGDILTILKRYNCICILGNHDAMALGILEINNKKDDVYGITEIRKTLKSEELQYLRSWPTHISITNPYSGIRIYFVHGSPADPLGGYIYRDTHHSDLNHVNHDVIFFGQTHHPFILKSRECLLVNVGSCGLPRDVGNLGSYGVYDSQTNTAEIKRFEFNVDTVIKRANRVREPHPSVINCLNREKY